ncbi:MAG: hypothetical protein F4Z19_03555 [Holophagales bacterium]|nr:hypothetical protein [Holophagales bacterium]
MRPLTQLLPAVLLALPVTAQPPYAPPTEGLPQGVGEFCGGPIVVDLPHDEPWRATWAARDELPDLPRWCDGTCVVDIAFIYGDDAVGGARPDGRPHGPQTLGELRRDIEYAVNMNNIAWRRAGLDARLRIVGVERDPRVLTDQWQELRRSKERLPEVRRRFGADLLYSITPASRQCGLAHARGRGTSAQSAVRLAAVGAVTSACLTTTALAHEVGHNLGLAHHPEDVVSPTVPYVPFGHGYRKFDQAGVGLYGSIMGGGEVYAFSTSEHPVRGRALGDPQVRDAVRALRYTIPDATRYSPTVIPEAQQNPKDYGCKLSSINACVNNWRFTVFADYSTETLEKGQARVLDTFGLGDSASLFYFFDHANPELLVKVINGCWLNDHYWVFGSAATDLKYNVVIGDLATADAEGQVSHYNWYTHRGGGLIIGPNGYSTDAGVISDTRAFPCNP